MWAEALGWGALAAAGLIAGAAIGLLQRVAHRGVAAVMAVGAGVLLAAFSLDLVHEAAAAASLPRVGGALLAGAATFSVANAALATALPLVVAFGLGNLPEAMSSASGMRLAGRSTRSIVGLWTGISAGTVLGVVIGHVALRGVTPATAGTIAAFSAGALLAVVAETMIPEAVHRAPRFAGLLVVAGFTALLAVLAAIAGG